MLRKIFKSSLFKSAGIYGGTSIINAAIPFLMMPILTRAMNPADYGIVAMFGVLFNFSLPFIGVSTHSAIARQYFNPEQYDIKVYITNCFLILVGSAIVVLLGVLLFSGPISQLSAFPRTWLWTIIVASVCSYIATIVLTIWQMQSKPLPYGIFQISNTLFSVALSLWFVLGEGMAWDGRVLAQLITFLLFAIIGVYILFKNKWFKFQYNPAYIKNALQYGWPLIPHAIGAVIMTMSDRMFITNMVGLDATGLYSVGYALGSIIGFVENSFNLAYIPWLYEKLNLNDENFKRRIVKLTYIYFASILTLALLLSFGMPYFLSIFVGKKFLGAQAFIFWVAMSFAFGGMYKMVVNYIFYVGKTTILAWITFSSAIANLPLNYFLIKYYGAVGAAMATCFVSVFFFFLTWILSSRIYKMPWLLRKTSVSIG